MFVVITIHQMLITRTHKHTEGEEKRKGGRSMSMMSVKTIEKKKSSIELYFLHYFCNRETTE